MQSLWPDFSRVNANCTQLISDILLFYMENISTSLDIRNPGLRTLLPEVERYYIIDGGLSIFQIIQS